MNTIHELPNFTYSQEEIKREIHDVTVKRGNLSHQPKMNKMVRLYQPHFFQKERELWKNDSIRSRLIENREQYLNKKLEDMTLLQILSGFKISGIHRGFSHFSPLWFKWFIEQYKPTIVYDPFGGWGHRALCAPLLQKYIYNDLNTDSFNGIVNFKNDFNIDSIVAYNRDAATFIPDEHYDSVFTCPPYDDVEDYGVDGGVFTDYIDSMVENIFHSKDSVATFGIVIREDFYKNLKFAFGRDCESKHPINEHTNHFTRNKRKTKLKEFLYIWTKTPVDRKQEIVELFTRADGRLNSVKIKHASHEIVNEIIELTPQFEDVVVSLSFRLLALKENRTDVRCPTCGSVITKKNDKGQIANWCNSKCYQKSLTKEDFKRRFSKVDRERKEQRRKRTMIERYGSSSPIHLYTDSVQERITQTRRQHCSKESWDALEDKDNLIDLHYNQEMT